MRIFWIGPDDEGAGAEIVDRKLKASLAKLGYQIDTFSPKPVSRLREVVNLSLLRMPYYRARFESPESRRAIRAISGRYDAVVAAWEPFDSLALRAPRSIPIVMLLHNVTSTAIRSVFPGHPLATYLARRGARWEQRAYGDRRVRAVATLSVDDQRYVQSLVKSGTSVLYTPPGMPPMAELSADARFVPELLISGTYGWFPKRRDVNVFAEEYAALPPSQRIPIVADGQLPEQAALRLSARPFDAKDSTQRIRLGLISDRFESGHKLKTAFYLANNAFVLTYADVSRDFEGIPDQAFFIRRIRRASDIAAHANELRALPAEPLRARLEAFKQACQQRFSWDGAARVMADALQRIVSSSSVSPPVPSG